MLTGLRMWRAPTLAFLITFGLVETAIEVAARQDHEHQLNLLQTRAVDLLTLLQTELNTTLYLANGVDAFIKANQGSIDPLILNPWMNTLVKDASYIRNIGLAPDNRISYIWPLEGNEKALGLYYPDIPAQWAMVQKVIERGLPTVSPPVRLVQGGMGLIYRIPVYLQDKHYWGMVSTVLDAEALFAFLDRHAEQLNLDVSLSVSGQKDPFLNSRHFDNRDALELPVPLPGTEWTLSAGLKQSTENAWTRYRWIGLFLALGVAGATGYQGRVSRDRRAAGREVEQAELRFSRAFEMAPMGMLIVDEALVIQSVNSALMKLTDFSRDQVLGASVKTLFANADEQGFEYPLRVLSTQGRDEVTWESGLLMASGEAIECLWHVSELPEQDAGRSYIFQCQDLREQRRLERLKNEFVSTVSHELRTPITAINGALAMLQHQASNQSIDAMQRQLLDIAVRNSKRLHLLINDLLDMERITSGSLQLDIRPLRPQVMVEQCVEALIPYAEQFQVRLNATAQPGLPTCQADPDRLQQVLVNLLSNAIKFSPTGAEVMLQAIHVENRIRFSAIDAGPGIPAKFREQIFRRFSQADSSDTRSKGGTGLGLAISRELVERMGGVIGFESEPGVRTEFYAEFPLA